jgi:hypothetical protein
MEKVSNLIMLLHVRIFVFKKSLIKISKAHIMNCQKSNPIFEHNLSCNKWY